VVSMGRHGQGRASRLRIVSLSTFSWAPGQRAVPTCPGPGPGVMRAGPQWPRV
jgi:hypothetical protein